MKNHTAVMLWLKDGKADSYERNIALEEMQMTVTDRVIWSFKHVVYQWTWRDEEGCTVTEYTVIAYYANWDDVENGYRQGESVTNFFLIEDTLCDCCAHVADNG